MDISGEDYVLYANKSPLIVEEEFIKQLKKKWQNPVIEEFERDDHHLELFFAKDDQMNAEFDEIAYALNKNNEGCFMFCARMFDYFEPKIRILKEAGTQGPDTAFFLKNVWEYTLVLPSLITESTFSNDLYVTLQSILEHK